MRKIFFLSIIGLLILTSCGSLQRKMFGTTEKDLIRSVSIEQGCPKENIQVLGKVQTFGNATYSLNVCGKKVVYKQVGSVFMTAEKADKLLNK